ncbi:hypothetical protein [Aestuariispira insulae]|uniref:Uncharacterized protein n=1 Tax=Aestuariispira insulae TaxID=1461337 RepID=A0A3D9H0P3_9PROT|nr:hypothetical protein [Aestuariispira insulae]RED43078.1 hypothetical protein DFP90_1393 [Aestuariispira insulae]
MFSSEQRHLDAEEQLKKVKAICDQTPAGEKKDEVMQFYIAAEDAHKMRMNNKCIAQLAKAREVLK